MNDKLPEMKSFLIPGGHPAVSLHILPVVFAAGQNVGGSLTTDITCSLTRWL